MYSFRSFVLTLPRGGRKEIKRRKRSKGKGNTEGKKNNMCGGKKGKLGQIHRLTQIMSDLNET